MSDTESDGAGNRDKLELRPARLRKRTMRVMGRSYPISATTPRAMSQSAKDVLTFLAMMHTPRGATTSS